LSRIEFLPYENLTKTTPLTGGNERSFVRKDEDNCRKKKGIKNGSPTLEKRIRRKGRRNLSKLQKKKKKRRLGFLKVRTQPLGASQKKKKREKGGKRNKERR
jgi:hypothetical protein